MMIQITWRLSTTTRGHFIPLINCPIKYGLIIKIMVMSKVINEYDLVLFTLRSNQAGTYKCKAVSLSDPNKHVTLSERTVTFASGFFCFARVHYFLIKRRIQRSITLCYQYRCTLL